MNDIKRIVLSVLTSQGTATGYTLSKDISEVWPVSHQQLYRELADLTKLGLIEFKVVAQEGKPDKKCYSITDFGHDQMIDINKEPIGDFAYRRSSSIAHVLGTTDSEALVKKLTVYVKSLNKEKTRLDRMEKFKNKNGEMMPIAHKRSQLLIGAEIEWVEIILGMFDSK